MHVLLIHQAFAGPGDAGGTRHYELSRHLAARGHRVTIVASELNYLTGTKTPAGAEALPPGIEIVRVPVRGSLHDSYLTRAANFVSFVTAATRAALRVRDVDVVWGTTPPLPQLFPAWLASLRSRAGLVMEERDLWPEFAIGMGLLRDGALARAALVFKKLMYGRAARVVINSPGFRPFLDRYGVDPRKVRMIPNGVDVDEFEGADGRAVRRELDLADAFVILYAGALGPANGLDVVLDAAEQLRGTPALFLLVGDGKARADLTRAAAERGLENVRFVAAQPKSRIPSFVAAADACLATLRPIPLFRTTYPNKVFDYMAGARPVLLAIDGVIREVVEEAGAGVFTPPGDATALAGAVREMMSNREAARAMGERGRTAVRARFDRPLQGAQLDALFEELLSGAARSPEPVRVKRLIDVLVSALVLVIASPLMLLIAAAILLSSGTPVLFAQTRTGLGGRLFTFFKFRTMLPGEPGEPDASRLTGVGRVLRATSLDELPQLWNVLRGDMSLVGPRPLLPQYLERYTAEQARRHEVQPGVTGYAQISGRNTLSWEDKFALDVWYVEHRSTRLDLWILWRTLVSVLRGDGVSAPGHATMPEFMGTAATHDHGARR